MTVPQVTVVRVISRLAVGGPALHVVNLTKGLYSHPTVIVTGEVAVGEVDVTASASAAGVIVHTIPSLGRDVRPWQDLRTFIALYRFLKRTKPKIVHTHTAKAGTIGRLAAWAAGVPVRVHTFHGHVFHDYFGKLKTSLFIRIERMLSRITTRVIAVSPRQAAELVNTYRVCRRDQVRVVPLGLELERFWRTDAAVLRADFRSELGVDRETVVVSVARLVPIKNHALLLQAAARVNALDQSFLFVIVGGGSEEERLRDQAATLGIAHRVRFLGWRDDLERIYAGADIVALSSLNEGTPVCLIEALAAGCSVVSTDVGGVRDVLEDGKFGTLVPSSDAAALSSAIVSAASGVNRQEANREAVSRVVRERYGVVRLVRDVGALYDELLAADSLRQP